MNKSPSIASTLSIVVLTCVLTSILTFTSAQEVVHLDDSNFKEMTAGKIVFIKFYAPWCGHSKEMANDWAHLGKVMTRSDVLIGEVDCTSEASEDTCEENDVDGFPSLKYGEGNTALEEYFENRDFNTMYLFALKNLKVQCSPNNLDACNATQQDIVHKFMDMDVDELAALQRAEDDKLDNMDEMHEYEINLLEEQFQKLEETKNAYIEELKKDHDYELVQQVLGIKTLGASTITIPHGDEL